MKPLITPVERPILEFDYDGDYTMKLNADGLNVEVIFDRNLNPDIVDIGEGQYYALDDDLHKIYVRFGYHMFTAYEVMIKAAQTVEDYKAAQDTEAREWTSHLAFYSNPNNR